MIRKLAAVAALLALAGCGSEADRPSGPDPAPGGPTGVALVFADSALHSAVEAAAGETGDAAGLVTLTAKERGIANLEGIERLTRLEALDLYGNEIRDLSPLAGLRRLRYLDLGNNRVEDLSPLASLKGLQVLLLADNGVTEVSGLAGLDSLQNVDLTGNPLGEAAQTQVAALRERGVAVDFAAPEGPGDGASGVILGELPIVFASSRRTGSPVLEVHSLDPKTGEVLNLSDNLARMPLSDGSLPDTTARRWPGRGEEPAQLPDGSRIAFSSYRDGNQEIYVMDAAGGDPVNLTLHEAWDASPVWSPDGRRIAFVSDRNGDVEIWPDTHLNTDIFVMNADGSGVEQVTSDALSMSAESPAWSPDGSSIAFTKWDEGSTGIYVLRLSSGEVRLVSEDRTAWSPSWSPDGRWIAHIGRGGNLWVMAVDGGQIRQLTFGDEFWDEDPTWSPDGARIVFVREGRTPEDRDLYVISAEGGAEEPITDHPFADADPCWAPF